MALGKPVRRVYIVDDAEYVALKAQTMADLTVRDVSEEVLAALQRQAAANGRSVEAEHRELLRAVLTTADNDFAARAAALRQRLRSSVDSVDTIRAHRSGVP